jgi:glycosyltransferase involved in cell wall biosynthesis
MKILIINSRYFLSAGPEKYMFGLIEILKKHEHEVIPFSVKNSKNVKTPYEKYFAEPVGGKDKVYFEEYNKTNLKTISQMIGRQYYSYHVKNRLKKLIRDTKPDIAYVLHHYNKLSPSVITACRECNLPVIMRLSDFFLVCPEGHLLRQSKPCEECIDKSLFSAVKHKCVKDSYLASAIKASALAMHRAVKIYEKVDHIVSPSTFTIMKVNKVLHKKIINIPTFVYTDRKYNPKVGTYALFVGRVEPEKGLMWAIKSFEKTKFPLKIIGDSHSGYDAELKKYVLDNKIKNVEFLGAKFGSELDMYFKNSRFVIMPNIWYENMPNVALETMSHSKPILTSDLGSMKEIVKENYNGFLVKPNDVEEFRKKAVALFKDDKLCQELGKNAFNEIKLKYDPQIHYKTLIALFEQTIADKKSAGKKANDKRREIKEQRMPKSHISPIPAKIHTKTKNRE